MPDQLRRLTPEEVDALFPVDIAEDGDAVDLPWYDPGVIVLFVGAGIGALVMVAAEAIAEAVWSIRSWRRA